MSLMMGTAVFTFAWCYQFPCIAPSPSCPSFNNFLAKIKLKCFIISVLFIFANVQAAGKQSKLKTVIRKKSCTKLENLPLGGFI